MYVYIPPVEKARDVATRLLSAMGKSPALTRACHEEQMSQCPELANSSSRPVCSKKSAKIGQSS